MKVSTYSSKALTSTTTLSIAASPSSYTLKLVSDAGGVEHSFDVAAQSLTVLPSCPQSAAHFAVPCSGSILLGNGNRYLNQQISLTSISSHLRLRIIFCHSQLTLIRAGS